MINAKVLKEAFGFDSEPDSYFVGYRPKNSDPDQFGPKQHKTTETH